MARKKRKYVRRKPYRQEVMPISPIFIGLVPFLLLISLATGYILYQYRIPLPVPSELPEFHVPEITFSFDEIFSLIYLTGQKMGEQAIQGITTIVDILLSGAVMLIEFIVAIFTNFHQGLIAYITNFQLTIKDFFSYLDIPGKIHIVVSAILWPFHFLNPSPAIEVGAEKTEEGKELLNNFLSPISPFISLIWEEIKRTLIQLWEGVRDLFSFIGLLLKGNN